MIIVLTSIKQIKRKTKIIRQCYLMVENIEIYLGYKNSSIKEIFNEVCNTNLYDELEFIQIIKSNINNNCDNVINENILICVDSINLLDNKDKDNVKSFLFMLGKTDLNGQIMNCKFYKEYFKTKLKSLEENENNKCKSISAIIIGLGLFITIIVA